MQQKWGIRGMAVAPHSLASGSALAVLREGGNALEAMVAAAATIAVVYPHMNSIGGDSFWVIHSPGKAMGGIDACGAAAGLATKQWYADRGITQSIPFRGALAANTVAGTISGWGAAQRLSKQGLGGKLPLSRLLADAIYYAEHGVPVTYSQSSLTAKKQEELSPIPGFAKTFLVKGEAPEVGSIFKQERLARTLDQIARKGTDDYYRGDLANSLAQELTDLGSPLRLDDLRRHRAQLIDPLQLKHSMGKVYNMTPPTQGVVSLMIIGILDQLNLKRFKVDSAEYVHLCVEATKQAFKVRDEFVTDPAYMKRDPQSLLSPAFLKKLASNINLEKALPWGQGKGPADTIWMGVVDGQGNSVSFIQSIYHEFGAGIVLPSTGVNWQNRGCSFSLDPATLNHLEPYRKPFHTLNPALALFKDGRTMVYGTMGGDGQPQTQCAVFTRTAVYGLDPQDAISRPRWLLGRTWGQTSDSLKLESRFNPSVTKELHNLGHDIEMLDSFDESVGHAGCIIRDPSGTLHGGWDPRSDGAVSAF
ncbi:gamma-glutamyltranspeptidase / glutathione hydrolase [Polynucleobacter meluiroseus]|uniref:Gamma-glutamyltranspeptidase / glutathione hydrolase n=1 Tax=Polynucleobacter meluiroseus TaxID=1938814 RepID=A0A240E1X3_9BURK|nr:gamma-glutamyltransferase family protein [Polynucleobacter meluiroseus]SNX28501.1 gamma-glutamyltranspeptidase / glutathione hydrolase [Polynucleobacter meluiroseus]